MKKFLIVCAVSVVLLTGAVLAVYFELTALPYEADVYERIAAYTIFPLWVFSAVPAYVLTVEWLQTKTFAQGFWLGYIFGLFCPLIIAPVLMVIYFVGTIEKLINKR